MSLKDSLQGKLGKMTDDVLPQLQATWADIGAGAFHTGEGGTGRAGKETQIGCRPQVQ